MAAFVLPTEETCVDGLGHWFRGFLGNMLSWCCECGVYTKDAPSSNNVKIVTPGVYKILDSSRKYSHNNTNGYHTPDENCCINGDKHAFKKVQEVVLKKEPKESKVIEVCGLCGTLTISRYRYTEGPLGTSNKTKITRTRRRVQIGSSSTRLNFALVPDIYHKMERVVPKCSVDKDKNVFWWYANLYDTGSWMDDIAGTGEIAVPAAVPSPKKNVKKTSIVAGPSVWPLKPGEYWTS